MSIPARITRFCPASGLPDLEFSLACQGYKVLERTQTPDGWRLTAEPCPCPVCTAGRQERAETPKPRRKRRDPARPVSKAEGQRFFDRLRKEIAKA